MAAARCADAACGPRRRAGWPSRSLLLSRASRGRVARRCGRSGAPLAAGIERRARAAEFRGRVDDFCSTRRSAAPSPWSVSGAATAAVVLAAHRGTRSAARPSGWARGASRPTLGAHAERSRRADERRRSGFLLAGYRFDRYRSERRPRRVGEPDAGRASRCRRPRRCGRCWRTSPALADGVFGARDLVNEPPSVATPRFLAEYAQRLAEGVAGAGGRGLGARSA